MPDDDARVGESELAGRERALVEAFVAPSKRSRYLSLLSGKRREKVLATLDHWRDADPRYASPVESGASAYELLVRLGAPKNCHLISSSKALDGRVMDLDDAITEVELSMCGALIGCVPGKLALFIGEPPKNLLLLRR